MKNIDPLEAYFMRKFKEMGIKVVPPVKGKKGRHRRVRMASE